MWIGCHADSHEYARWFGDDIAVRRGSYLVDWSGLPYQRFLLTNIGHGESLLQRLKTTTTLYANARGHISQLIHSHCTSAALLAQRIGLADDVQTALRLHVRTLRRRRAAQRRGGRGHPDRDAGRPARGHGRGAPARVRHRGRGGDGAQPPRRAVRPGGRRRIRRRRREPARGARPPETRGRWRCRTPPTATPRSTDPRWTPCSSRSATSSTSNAPSRSGTRGPSRSSPAMPQSPPVSTPMRSR